MPLSPPRSRSPNSAESIVDEVEFNGLQTELILERHEKLYDYNAGGHHPVLLNDCLGPENQYKICRDLRAIETTKYVAVKILMAWYAEPDDLREYDHGELIVIKLKETRIEEEEGGKIVPLPIDEFRIHGLNGEHMCFAHPVLGPRDSCVIKNSDDPGKDLREIAYQVVQGMAALHRQGICHSDFTPNNIILRITPLDGLTEAQVLTHLGHPQTNPVTVISTSFPPGPTAPEYLVYPINFYRLSPSLITASPCIIDFSESFSISQPPPDLGTPRSYCSPEMIFDKKAGVRSDLWALGCTLFEIRTGRKLFDTFDGEVAGQVVYVGGRRWNFEEKGDEDGRAVFTRESEERKKDFDKTHSGWYEERSIRKALEGGLSYGYEHLGTKGEVWREIGEVEMDVFADLLGRILRFEVEKRMSAEEILEHPWFKM